MSVPAALAEFAFVYWPEVRFSDLDVLGHVNNAVYSTYIESARLAYYMDLTGQTLDHVDIILAETTISFKLPALFGDRLAVGVRIASFGTKSFVMEYAIVRANDNALIATARSVQVAYDYTLNRSVPVSEALKEKVRSQSSGG